MLTNKTEDAVEITYDQRPIVTEAGEDLDVRDFGVPIERIVAVERHILLKNPNVFDQSKTEDQFKTAKAALKKVKDLEAEVKDLQAQVKEKDEAVKSAAEAEDKAKTELAGIIKENKSLVGQVKEIKAKLKAVK